MQTSAELKIHLVSFDVPYPPDYGGVIDVYYKLKALQEIGIRVILHCFTYKRHASAELENLCDAVYYYERFPMRRAFFSRLPMIVASRMSETLLHRIAADDYPVLLEGLHTCGWLGSEQWNNKRVVVRMHNNEHAYYAHLAKEERSLWKRWYFSVESRRLAQMEDILSKATAIACIAIPEKVYYQHKYKNAFYVGPFHGNDKVSTQPGKGDFVLYHGNLGINENNVAACYLVKEVFSATKHPVVIAGNQPSQELLQLVRSYDHITIIPNPSQSAMQQLISDAQLHVLVTFQATGIKLKLIQALFNGRFVIANKPMIEDSGLEQYVIVANTAEEQRKALEMYFNREMDAIEMQKRNNILQELSDAYGARLITDQLFPGALPANHH